MRISRWAFGGLAALGFVVATDSGVDTSLNEPPGYRTFSEIANIADAHDYSSSDPYNPNGRAFPRIVLINFPHTSDNYALLNRLLPDLVQEGNVLCVEGLDDHVQEHFEQAKGQYHIPEWTTDYLMGHYRHTMQSPFFTDITRMSAARGASLKGIDDYVLSVAQHFIREELRAGVSSEREQRLVAEFRDLSRARSRTMGQGLVELSRSTNSQIYFVAGGLHLGIIPEIDEGVTPQLKNGGISYTLLNVPIL